MNDVFLDDIVRSGEPDPGRRGSRRDGRKERDRRRRARRRRSVFAVVIAMVLVGGVGYAVATYLLPQISSFTKPEPAAADYPGPGHDSVDVTIPAGATGAQMGQILVDNGVVQSVQAFSAAFTANPDAAGIQPGTYRLTLEIPAADAVTQLLDPEKRVQVRVTVPEGFRADQVVDRISAVATIPVEDVQAAMEDTEATGLPAEAGGSYEGWLFPATYTFEPGTTATEMIATMVAKTVSVLDEKGVAAEDRERVLTIASLVVREAKSAEDARKIARAIDNRLEIDMKLDIDASVAYGLGKSGTELTYDDIHVTDTPYNLYLHTGLPPTPIASPGEDAIDAALNPADGPWLFWVTVNPETGETLFAETYAEHQQNVDKLRQWEAENSGSDG
ncbi:endolytic transglycosylase MltG [Actinotalea sp. M2MS4P-6]|uniref:endolytic transglycosylase MltG n=1 Tax=Actinotalea sp. M2MS4P-6 TaxID=2983762 RepID=UPI0021E4C90A|nr:endolytic transglycosylase MltG [Actinotalea sp. M2MS4P-6]MCV2394569.1 endolytic transglycosylase MltG [Actinotalea sp. M2MS4P-6]